MTKRNNRLAHEIILEIIETKAKVLDLGCGDGSLLHLLKESKQCRGSGIEINENAIYECMAKGITVSHGDIDSGLADYSDKRFDYVILSESLQEVLHPKKVILEALRVGKKAIVGIPNFCHIDARLQIFFKGKVPITKELPHEWFDTPNLRFLSLKDFRKFCHQNEIKVIEEIGINKKSKVGLWPNLLANEGIYVLEK